MLEVLSTSYNNYLSHYQQPFPGEWENNMKHGKGVYTYPIGDIYDGEWVAGLRAGHGSYTYFATSIKVIMCE
jgi:hypothetical protein